MHSSSGGFFATLLMFIPLVAVPALAIFGVPAGDSLKASLDADATLPGGLKVEPSLGNNLREPPKEHEPPDSELGDGFMPANTGANAAGGWSDPFHETSSTRGSGLKRTADASAGGNDFDPPERLRGSERSPRSRPNTPLEAREPVGIPERSKFDDIPFGEPPTDKAPVDKPGVDRAPEKPLDFPDPKPSARRDTRPRSVRPPETEAPPAAAPALDWRTATARLKQLGISEYQLTPGGVEQPFVFTCRYPSPDNPRVVRRFEAEASDPLQAVQDVLSQVEEWKSQSRR